MGLSFREKLENIKQGHHGCIFYDNTDDAHTAAMTFIKIGLARNERCVFLGDPLSLARFTLRLLSADIDPKSEVSKGNLVLTSERNHLIDGAFNPDKMIEFLDNALGDALKSGRNGLRATGDVVWELGTDVDMKKLAEYEVKLDLFFPGKKLTGLCQYNLNVIPEEYLRHSLTSHNAVVSGEKVSIKNTFHACPASKTEKPFQELIASL